MLVLLAEDQKDLAELTIDYLESQGIECDYASDGAMAISLLANHNYDVVVLDIMMPRLDGFTVLQQLNDRGQRPPVLFLTARDALEDKLRGFELGADDYLTKPFELPELAARLKVLANRIKGPADQAALFQLDSLSIDHQQRIVSRDGRAIALSPSLWLLLTALAQHSPGVVDRITLENAVWPDQTPSKNMLKTLVFRLRNLIDGPDDRPLVHTIRGAGIALRVADEER